MLDIPQILRLLMIVSINYEFNNLYCIYKKRKWCYYLLLLSYIWNNEFFNDTYGDSTMSILKVDTINEKTSGNGVYIPGHVIQTVSKTFQNVTSTTSTSFIDVTGGSLAITPKSLLVKFMCSLISFFRVLWR